MPRALLISDLHLQHERPELTAALLGFLQEQAAGCDALFILGDLFEVWIGDDASTPLADSVADALRALTKQGSKVYLMHGNRDFLLGQDYASRAGAVLLPDPWLYDSPAGPVLLSHGDQLCSDDTDYMAFREMVRQNQWQQAFLARPIAEREAYARQARAQSAAATAGKMNEIMDVNNATVEALLQQHQQTVLIHGHTHRPAIHDISLDHAIAGQSEAKRVVLGDWGELAWYGEISPTGIKLESYPIIPPER